MKISAIVLLAAALLSPALADKDKQCTIGLSCECNYQGFNKAGQQYRCAVPGKYAVAYALCQCPDTYGGFAYAGADCIPAGKYNHRHKCRDGFNPDVVEDEEAGADE